MGGVGVTSTLAIDLGTANTLVWLKGQGIVLDEPTVIAVEQATGDVLSFGRSAYDTIARTSGSIVADRPLRGGAITDFTTTARLLRLLLSRLGATRFNRPRVLMCVPSTSTAVERRAVVEAVLKAGAGSCHLMEEPMAAAIGAGLPVAEPVGSMVVDVGGGTSEVAVCSLGGVVVTKAVRVGGFDLDHAIAEYVRTEHDVSVGERAVEALKLAVGSAYPQREPLTAEIRGRELATGMPRTVVVGDEEVRSAIEPQVATIVGAVLAALADCPPELTHDVLDAGMHLVGGGALLRGLDARLARETEVDVHVAARPLEAVVSGAGQTVETSDDLRALFADR